MVVAAGSNGYDGVSCPPSTPSGRPLVRPVIAVGASPTRTTSTTVSVAGAPPHCRASRDGRTTTPTLRSARTRPGTRCDHVGDVALAAQASRPVSQGTALINATSTNASTACSFATKVDNAYDAGTVGVILYMADSTAPIPPGNLITTAFRW